MSEPKQPLPPETFSTGAAEPPPSPAAAPETRAPKPVATVFEVVFKAKGPKHEFIVTRGRKGAVLVGTVRWVVRSRGAAMPDKPIATGTWDDTMQRIVVMQSGITEFAKTEFGAEKIGQILRAANDAIPWEEEAAEKRDEARAAAAATPMPEVEFSY